MGLLQLSRARHLIHAGAGRAVEQTASQELGREDLVGWLEDQVSDPGIRRVAFALLVVNLRRSDRTSALMRRPLARASGREAARRLSEALRPQDRFARLDPEHLLVVLPQVSEAAVVMLAVSRIIRQFEAPIEIGRDTVRMRPCVGSALTSASDAVDIDALVSAADRACVTAQSAEDGFAMGAAAPSSTSNADDLLDEFQAALQANELEVWLQPQCQVASGACVAAEALLRWKNQRRNQMISPALVVEIAENHGLMTALTTFVLNTSLRQLSALRRAGIDLRMAVNISASSLRDAELPELVARSLATWGVSAEQLTIEITESALMTDVDRSLQSMHELEQLGVRLSIDDFGTGYSSLAYLRRMPLDELKIDRAFVQNMVENKADVQIVQSVIDLAHNFELEAVAEGVEDQATLEILARLGCDVIQGYHYARPMPTAQLPAWWATRQR